jgi:hypothetical protein
MHLSRHAPVSTIFVPHPLAAATPPRLTGWVAVGAAAIMVLGRAFVALPTAIIVLGRACVALSASSLLLPEVEY